MDCRGDDLEDCGGTIAGTDMGIDMPALWCSGS